MRAAFAVVCRSAVERAVVVVEDEMLSFVAHDVGDALQIPVMLGDDKNTVGELHYHPGGVNVAALIVHAPRILVCGDGDVRRVSAAAIFRPVGARDKDRVVRMSQPCPVSMTAGDVE